MFSESTELFRTDRIACIGAGYVGAPSMAVIAERCPDIAVHVYDHSAERIAAWLSDSLPIYEPGLEDIVKKCRGRNLFFSTNLAEGIANCDIIFICVNTPTKTFGAGNGAAADLSYVEQAARAVALHARSNKVIVEKSTVPVRTADSVSMILHANCKTGLQFVVLSNPEFLAEGTAVRNLLDPDRVLIGGPQHTPAGSEAVEMLCNIYGRWIPKNKILTTNVWSAELSKLAANAFLAQRISSINAIAALCDKTGADAEQVSLAIGRDSRIGSKFLKASVGFGGSCFEKDILNLTYICEYFNLPEVADYWRKVVVMNDLQKTRFTENIIHSMFSTISGKRIAVFGFAYKKDTGDTRNTPALDVCAKLMTERAILCVYDPKVSREAALKEFKLNVLYDSLDLENHFLTMPNARQACKGAHAIVLLTEWDEFKYLNYGDLFAEMAKPAFIFDGRNILDHEKLQHIGFHTKAVGVHTEASSTHTKYVIASPLQEGNAHSCTPKAAADN